MAIDAGFWRDLFVTLGEERGDGAWSMTIYVKPFVRWVWLGTLLMCFGGLLAAADKRYRRVRESRAEAAVTEPSATRSVDGIAGVRV